MYTISATFMEGFETYLKIKLFFVVVEAKKSARQSATN